MNFGILRFKILMVLRLSIYVHIRRITNHHIEATFLENFGELLLPIECLVTGNGRVADKRIAALDILVQRVQLAVGLGGTKPKCQLGYPNTFLVNVYTIEVILKNIVFHTFER